MNNQNVTVPSEIRGWNWGAFFLNWIWGIGNNVWIALLCFVPCLGFIMPFVLGVKGNEWAWKNKRWESVEHFKKVQRIWAVVGAVVVVSIVVFIATIFLIVMISIKHTDVYKAALENIQHNSQAIEILGEPITDGFFMAGNINVNGPSGEASFSFPVKGPKGQGTVYIEATKRMGAWSFDNLALKPKGVAQPIPISPHE